MKIPLMTVQAREWVLYKIWKKCEQDQCDKQIYRNFNTTKFRMICTPRKFAQYHNYSTVCILLIDNILESWEMKEKALFVICKKTFQYERIYLWFFRSRYIKCSYASIDFGLKCKTQSCILDVSNYFIQINVNYNSSKSKILNFVPWYGGNFISMGYFRIFVYKILTDVITK